MNSSLMLLKTQGPYCQLGKVQALNYSVGKAGSFPWSTAPYLPALSYLFRQSQPGVRQLGPWNLRKEMEWGGGVRDGVVISENDS